MPLSRAERRTEVHTRTLDLHVYHREDDLFDIEGRLVDVKPITVEFHNSYRSAGEPVHDLRPTPDHQPPTGRAVRGSQDGCWCVSLLLWR